VVIKNSYKVIVGGNDVTSRFAPSLLSLEVSRAAGEAADSATISLADQDGMIALPKDRAPIQITLAGQWAFEGFVTEVECKINKGGGRTLDITASSIDQGGKAKEPMLQHKDNATLPEMMQSFGQKAGLNVQVLGSIASDNRQYWLQQNESFVSFGQRMAKEVGGTFKIIGNRAFLAARNEGVSASGRPLTAINAAWGDNLLEASVSPVISKPRFRKVKVSYFDIAKGEKIEEELETGIDGVDAALRTLTSAASQTNAKQRANSHKKEAERGKGMGQVTILGDATAEPEAILNLSGVRPGVDGAYRIDAVSHKVDKSSGFTTSITLREPQGSAGVDSR